MSQVERIVKEIISERLAVSTDQLGWGTSLRKDVGASDEDILGQKMETVRGPQVFPGVLDALEREFGIVISADEAQGLNTVGEFVTCIERLLAAPRLKVVTADDESIDDDDDDDGNVGVGEYLLTQLIGSLRHDDPTTRRMVVENLGKAGAAASSAIAELTNVMKTDPEDELRRLAASALADIGPHAVPWLIQSLATSSEVTAAAADQALVSIGIKKEDRFIALVQAMQDEDPVCRLQATRTLSDIMTDRIDATPFPCSGPMFQQAIKAFRNALSDHQSLMQIVASLALWIIRRDPVGAEVMMEIMQRSSDPDQELASRVFGLIQAGLNDEEDNR